MVFAALCTRRGSLWYRVAPCSQPSGATCHLPPFSQALIKELQPMVFVALCTRRSANGVLLHCALSHLGQQAQYQLSFAPPFTSADQGVATDGVLMYRCSLWCPVSLCSSAHRPNASYHIPSCSQTTSAALQHKISSHPQRIRSTKDALRIGKAWLIKRADSTPPAVQLG